MIAATEIRAGVTGHRSNRLVDSTIAELREHVRQVILTLAGATPHGRLIVVSALAEGADRLVGQEALAAGCDLVCPLPFQQDEYLRDFATEVSRAEFRALLGRATDIIELPGTRTSPEGTQDAYAAVGQYIVEAADLLIAVWDGQSARGSGGTADVVAAALARRIPVIWIDALTPHRIQVVTVDNAGGRVYGTMDDLAQRIAKHPDEIAANEPPQPSPAPR